MSRPHPLAAALLALSLAACQHEATERDAIAPPTPAADDVAAHIKVVASDAFGGRGPGSDGEEKTVAYLREQFLRLGLQPGNGDSFFQTVPMVETTADTSASTLRVDIAGKPHALAFGDQMVLGTRTAKPDVTVNASPMVFVGYGV